MEWNNHPFEKDTPVRTFGSRSGLAAWDAENCDRCIKHDECELCDAITAAYIGDGRVRAVRCDHGGVHRRRAGTAVGRQADRMSI